MNVINASGEEPNDGSKKKVRVCVLWASEALHLPLMEWDDDADDDDKKAEAKERAADFHLLLELLFPPPN